MLYLLSSQGEESRATSFKRASGARGRNPPLETKGGAPAKTNERSLGRGEFALTRGGNFEALGREFENCPDLLTRQAIVQAYDILQRQAVFQVLENSRHGNTRASEYPSSANLPGHAFPDPTF